MPQSGASSQLGRHAGWSRLVSLIVTIALIACSYLTVLQANFADAAKLNMFLRNAKTLYHTAEMIKAEVVERLPQKVKENVIEQAIAQKLLDIIVTPNNLARLVEPAVELSYRTVSKAPVELKNNQVVLETKKYKDQASQFLKKSSLPPTISEPATDIVANAPNEITVVDGNKSPNSPVIQLLKVRDTINAINVWVAIMWWTIIIGLAVLIVLNLRNYRQSLHYLGWIFGFAGAFLVVGSFVFPPILQLVIPPNNDPVIGSYINQLVADALTYLFDSTRPYGLFFALIAVVVITLKRLNVIAKLTAWVKKLLTQQKHKPAHHHSHKK